MAFEIEFRDEGRGDDLERAARRGMAFDAIWRRVFNLEMPSGYRVNTHSSPGRYTRSGRPCRLAPRALFALLLGVAAGLLSEVACATTFGNVYYDASTDQLVVTMIYRGTNPNHTFSLKWGRCKAGPDGSPQIFANVIDSQWDDAAQNDYQTTTHFNLGKLKCRPVNVTLRSAPRFIYQLQIPAPPASAQQ